MRITKREFKKTDSENKQFKVRLTHSKNNESGIINKKLTISQNKSTSYETFHEIEPINNVLDICEFRNSYIQMITKELSEKKAKILEIKERSEAVHNFVKYVCNCYIDSEIKLNLDELRTIFKEEFYGEKKIKRSEVISYSLSIKGNETKISDHEYYKTFPDLINYVISCYILTENEVIDLIRPINELIVKKLTDKQRCIAKSLVNNKILFTIENGELKPTSNKYLWLRDKMFIKNNEEFELNEAFLIEMETAYKFDKLKLIIGQAKTSVSMKIALREHERDNLNFVTGYDGGLEFYILEVREYFSHYFPIKKNKRTDKIIKDDKKHEIDSTYFNYYAKIDIVKKTVRNQIINQLIEYMIKESKIQSIVNEKKDCSEITSLNLEAFRVKEAFKKQLIELVSIATTRFSKMVSYDVNGDVLSDFNNKYIGNLTEDKKDKLQQQLKYFFVLPNDNTLTLNKREEDIEKALKLTVEIHKSIYHIRNNLFHFANNDVKEIFNTSISEDTTFIDNIFNNDKQLIRKKFIEKIFSMNLPLYYDENFLLNILELTTFKLVSLNLPFIPSFQKVFDKGMNMQSSGTTDKQNYLIPKNGFFIEPNNNGENYTDEKQAAKILSGKKLAYKNFLQLIYINVFIPQIEENNELITNHINTIIEKNKNVPSNLNKSKNKDDDVYKYEKMSLFDENDTLAIYFKKLQSEIILAQAKDAKQVSKKIQKQSSDSYFDFLKDLFAYSFNDYLSNVFCKKITNFESVIKKPMLQDIEFNMQAIFGNSHLSNDNDIEIYDKYDEKLKIDCSVTSLESNSIKLHHFYTLIKMLDSNHLSYIKNEFIKYGLYFDKINNYEDKSFVNNCIELINIVDLSIPNIIIQKEDTGSGSDLNNVLDGFFNDLQGFSLKSYGDIFYQSDNETPVLLVGIEKLKKCGMINYYQKHLKETNKITKTDYNNYIARKNEIETAQTNQKKLHKELVKLKHLDRNSNKLKQYKYNMKVIKEHGFLKNKIYFHDVNLVNNINIEIMSRLVGFVSDFERDFYFFLQYLHRHSMIKNVDLSNLSFTSELPFTQDQFKKHKLNIIDALFIHGINYNNSKPSETQSANEKVSNFLNDNLDFKNNIVLKTFLPNNGFMWTMARNDLAHLEHLKNNKKDEDLLHYIENTRKLMSYDRKRKNAVTKAIIDILLKHNLELEFTRDKTSDLFNVIEIKSKNIVHLKNLKNTKDLVFDLNSENTVALLKNIFIKKTI